MFFLAGGLVGMAVTYSLVLNPIEQIAWQMFWTGLENGRQVFDSETILKSSTFFKLATGALVGGVVASGLAATVKSWVQRCNHD